jgi:hypothetical protein
MVLEKDGRPMLCLGGIATSLPPQCGDVPISNWDWDKVGREERLNGVTWGDYRVVGTFDGTEFTVLEAGPPRRPDKEYPRIEAACPEPRGGWRASDPSRATEADRDTASRLAESQPDFAGLWVKIFNPPADVDVYGPDDVVLNVAFTGDLDRHRQELAAVWGGPMCVVKRDRPMTELLRIQDELSSRWGDEIGFQLLSSNVDVVNNRVEVELVLVDDRIRAAVDDLYGEGTVRLDSVLTPVPED